LLAQFCLPNGCCGHCDGTLGNDVAVQTAFKKAYQIPKNHPFLGSSFPGSPLPASLAATRLSMAFIRCSIIAFLSLDSANLAFRTMFCNNIHVSFERARAEAVPDLPGLYVTMRCAAARHFVAARAFLPVAEMQRALLPEKHLSAHD